MDIFMSVCDPKNDFVEGTMRKQEYVQKQNNGEHFYPSELIEEVDSYYSDVVVIEANCGDDEIEVSYDEFCSWDNKEKHILELLKENGIDVDNIDVINVSNICEVDG